MLNKCHLTKIKPHHINSLYFMNKHDFKMLLYYGKRRFIISLCEESVIGVTCLSVCHMRMRGLM